MGAPEPLVAIEIMTSIAGLDFSWRPRQTVELPPEEAAKWTDGQRAHYVNPPPAAAAPLPASMSVPAPQPAPAHGTTSAAAKPAANTPRKAAKAVKAAKKTS